MPKGVSVREIGERILFPKEKKVLVSRIFHHSKIKKKKLHEFLELKSYINDEGGRKFIRVEPRLSSFS